MPLFYNYSCCLKTSSSKPEPGEWIAEHFHVLYLITAAPDVFANWFTSLASEDEIEYYFNFSNRILDALIEMELKKFLKEYKEATNDERKELLTAIKKNGGFIKNGLFDAIGDYLHEFADRHKLTEQLTDIFNSDGESFPPENLFHLSGRLDDAFKLDLKDFIEAHPEFRQNLSLEPNELFNKLIVTSKKI